MQFLMTYPSLPFQDQYHVTVGTQNWHHRLWTASNIRPTPSQREDQTEKGLRA